MAKQPWTVQEIHVLLSSNDKNLITLPNRTKRAIHQKLLQLKLIKPAFKVTASNKKIWTEEELNLLRSAKDPKKVEISGRSKSSIAAMARRLNLYKKNLPRKPWTKDQEDLLQKLKSQGKTPQQIFEMGVLPYSKMSIQKKLGHLGLSKTKFTYDHKLCLTKFLKENWQGKTPQQLVNLWNDQNIIKVSRKKITKYLNRLNLRLPKGEGFRIGRLYQQEKLIKQRQNFPSSYKMNDKIRSLRVELMRKRMEENKNIWTGMPLSKEEMSLFDDEVFDLTA